MRMELLLESMWKNPSPTMKYGTTKIILYIFTKGAFLPYFHEPLQWLSGICKTNTQIKQTHKHSNHNNKSCLSNLERESFPNVRSNLLRCLLILLLRTLNMVYGRGAVYYRIVVTSPFGRQTMSSDVRLSRIKTSCRLLSLSLSPPTSLTCLWVSTTNMSSCLYTVVYSARGFIQLLLY